MAFKWFKKNKEKKTVTSPQTTDQDEERTPPAAGRIQDYDTSPADPTPPTVTTDPKNKTLAAEATSAAAATVPDVDPKKSLFSRLKTGLTKTRQFLTADLEDLFQGKGQLDDEKLEELEELLITADIGVRTTTDLMDAISKKSARISGPDDLKALIREEILSFLPPPSPASDSRPKPHVMMVVGVNGVGKTTTIGKLAAGLVQQGESVLIAAADTFRAAAIEQLAIWAERAGADFVHHKPNADPAAVAFDSIKAAQARDIDWVLVDTAGRLHTKVNLMEELKKIKRTITKIIPDAPHDIYLVLDATTGQNAMSQAKLFNESLEGITGLVLTKLDGTAKGGVVLSICRELSVPITHIGVGEAVDDLQPFDARQFVEALI